MVAAINPKSVTLCASNSEKHGDFWQNNKDRFVAQLLAKLPKSIRRKEGNSVVEGQALNIKVEVDQLENVMSMQIDESYSIEGIEKAGNLTVVVRAVTIFGARHGLETLSQLVVFDDLRRILLVCILYKSI